MGMLRYFLDAAVELDDRAKAFDEGIRFPLCQEGQFESLVCLAGLKQVAGTPIEVSTVFKYFDDYWMPFLGNAGPAPGYDMSLPKDERHKLEDKLRETLPTEDNGSISLTARAWAVKGTT